jgi:uncharacterized protein YndB with AHSA1/START domain
MTPVVMERILPAGVERVFDFVTRRENLLTWWGPEGVTLPDEALDFTRPGPWHSVMVNAKGQRFKVSGQVTKVKAPNLVAFTWGWHDEADRRGPESHVTIEISEAGPGKSRLVLSHIDLPDEEARKAHSEGWTSSLRKLEGRIAA